MIMIPSEIFIGCLIVLIILSIAAHKYNGALRVGSILSLGISHIIYHNLIYGDIVPNKNEYILFLIIGMAYLFLSHEVKQDES